jgi:group I intron endonuclease
MLKTCLIVMAKIYKATNKENGKFYIGKTSYDKLYKRKATHKWYANNTNTNLPFPNALRKYGIEKFIWEILEECDKNKAGEREIYWIQNLKPHYNATLGGDGGAYGNPCPEHVKEATRKARQRKVKNKKSGKIYNSLTEASEETKTMISSICRSCKNPNGTWEYENK